jgi:hypothetical protein
LADVDGDDVVLLDVVPVPVKMATSFPVVEISTISLDDEEHLVIPVEVSTISLHHLPPPSPSTISLDDEVVEIGRDLDGVEVSKDLTSRSRGVGAEPYSRNFA